MENIDPQIKNLVSAIGRAETGDSSPEAYTQKGKSGEFGRYQFMPETWKQWAPESGVDVNDTSIESQNKVAYNKVKQWKEAGLNPAQIASKWNSGDENKYKQNWKGVNEQGVAYDTPTYTQKVSDYYNETKIQSSGYNPKPYSQPGQFDITGLSATETPKAEPAKSTGFIGQLNKRAEDAGSAVAKTLTGATDVLKGNFLQGGKEVTHGLIQTAGGVAGAFGDVVGKLIEKTPVVGDFVKGLENIIGAGAKGFADSEAGHAVIKSVSDWAKVHPEMSKDISAGINIATAIPILKGFGVLKNVALDSASLALKGTAEKAVVNDLTKVAGKKAIPEDIKTLVDERAIPDIVDGKYSTKEASIHLDDAISKIEDEKLQPALAAANTAQISQRIPLETYRKQAIADAEDALMPTEGVYKLFDFVQKKYGDAPTLQQMNEAKRTFAGRIKESAYGSPEASALKITRSALQKSIEDGATAMGLGDVAAINQEMARLIKAQKQLQFIEGKNVKLGTVGGMIKNIATGAGEMGGSAISTPIAGAFIGRQTGGYVGKKVAGVGQGILNRTGKNAVRQSAKSAIKKTAGMIGATMVNKANR